MINKEELLILHVNIKLFIYIENIDQIKVNLSHLFIIMHQPIKHLRALAIYYLLYDQYVIYILIHAH